MIFTLQALTTATSTPATTNPAGVEITLVGGPNATARIPGTHNDPADLYGIILVFAAIAFAILLARWLLGRRGSTPERRG